MHKARIWKVLPEEAVQCRLCSHYCRIGSDERGYCGVRINSEGALYTLVYDRVAALNIDPVEKKPLFHFWPGSNTLSVGTMGCNLACAFCQNYSLSQPPRQGQSIYGRPTSPQELVQEALAQEVTSLAYTYSEPTIFFELVEDTARLAKEYGLKNIIVSNGFMSRECLKNWDGLIDAANIDLKSFREDFYTRLCGAKLKPVLHNLRTVAEMGWHMEITTLIIPGENDSDTELEELAGFIAEELGTHVPWHISRFHPAFHMSDTPPTPRETLQRAYDIGTRAGLDYIYIGNMSGHDAESTYCPKCKALVVKRRGFVLQDQAVHNGRCAECGHPIPIVGLGQTTK
ncbi:MAG: AmmeMemoRadiSam system radical SAM enzyme [Thermodesulfobacteriota bacterium]